MLTLIFSSDNDLAPRNLYGESEEEKSERKKIENKYADKNKG